MVCGGEYRFRTTKTTFFQGYIIIVAYYGVPFVSKPKKFEGLCRAAK